MIYNVKEFGATANGSCNDTKAIQAAADACRENGGGTVFVPYGNYLISSVRLYSNTTLELESGASFLLSDNESDYGNLRGKYDVDIKRDAKSLLGTESEENLSYLMKLFLEVLRIKTDCMFYAEGEKNITIKGGTFDGRYPLFYNVDTAEKDERPRWAKHENERYTAKKFRPQMMVFIGCENILLRDFRIIDAPFFNIRILECDTVRCENLDILSEKKCINTDGINIGSSKHCFIHGCRFVTGDDCIALSCGETQALKRNCEDIIVSNCIGNSSTNFIRIFSGIDVDLCYKHNLCGDTELEYARKQKVTNVSVSDCIVEDGGCGINIIGVYGSVEDITFKNIRTIQTSGDPAVFIAIQNDGVIKRITFDGLDCRAKGIATIIGTDRNSVSEIEFRNCRFFIEPKTKLFGNGIIDPLTQYWVASKAPYNFYVRHASDIILKDSSVKWGEADFYDIMEIADSSKRPKVYESLWREDMNPNPSFPCVTVYDADKITFDNFNCTGFNGCDWIKTDKTDNLLIK